MTLALLDEAVPVAWDAPSSSVGWVPACGLDWSLPFFADTVRGRFATFATGPEGLLESRGALPRLLIFSMGRAGSTLFTRLLERPGRFVCLREPAPINDLLLSPEGREPALLAACARALSHAAPAGDHALKLTSWNLLYAEVLMRALPSVPIVVLRRDPRAIAASWEREPPAWLGRGGPWCAGERASVILEAIERAAARLTIRAKWVFEHDQVAAAAPRVAAWLGLPPLAPADATALCAVHARHRARPYVAAEAQP